MFQTLGSEYGLIGGGEFAVVRLDTLVAETRSGMLDADQVLHTSAPAELPVEVIVRAVAATRIRFAQP